MYYNNYMKNRHNSKIEKRKKGSLKGKSRKNLWDYFQTISDTPTLGTIKELADSISIKQESLYWCFHNQNI